MTTLEQLYELRIGDLLARRRMVEQIIHDETEMQYGDLYLRRDGQRLEIEDPHGRCYGAINLDYIDGNPIEFVQRKLDERIFDYLVDV